MRYRLRIVTLPLLAAVLIAPASRTLASTAAFQALDRNGDGRLSAIEFASSGLTAQLFAEHDADNSDSLDAAEYQTLVSSLRANQRQGGPHPPRG